MRHISPENYHGLSVAYRRMEMYEDAENALRKMLSLKPAPITHRELGLLLRMTGNSSGAALHLSLSVQVPPLLRLLPFTSPQSIGLSRSGGRGARYQLLPCS